MFYTTHLANVYQTETQWEILKSHMPAVVLKEVSPDLIVLLHNKIRYKINNPWKLHNWLYKRLDTIMNSPPKTSFKMIGNCHGCSLQKHWQKNKNKKITQKSHRIENMVFFHVS